MTLPEQHFNETRDLLINVEKSKIASWLLEEGYYPEQYVLPPSFKVIDFPLKDEPYIKNLSDPPRRKRYGSRKTLETAER